MAKLSAVNRNKKRIKMNKRFEKKRKKLKQIIMDKKLSLEERFKAQLKLSKMPKNSSKLDWEVELGIVIGKEAKNISEKDSSNYILGYCLVNDISEREWQIEKMGQWVKGKSHDTFGPIGPYLVTSDEIKDVNNLNLSLDVNGKRMQTGNSKTMIFNVYYLVSYLSKFMSLQAGDIITTGTPPGVGMGMKPQVFLKAGDKMRLSIEHLGEQNSKVVLQ